MSNRVQCTIKDFEEFWIELPDEWLGYHAQRRDDAVRVLDEKKPDMGETLRKFSVSLALLDDWSLPGLSGNLENKDFEELSLSIIGWVNLVTLNSFGACFVLPKVSLSQSPAGLMRSEETSQRGSTEHPQS